MSATAQHAEGFLDLRSMFARPGVRKAVKETYARAKRRQGKKELATEVTQLMVASDDELKAMTPDELEAYADTLFLDSALPEDFSECDCLDCEAERASLENDVQPIPAYLEGSLPDWMLQEVQAAQGNSLELLSLFEAKRPSPKAAISTEDDALYA